MNQLKKFIYNASRATYASGDNSIKQKQLDGSTTILFEEGDYKFHDNYFGGEPYGGREVVFLNNKPIWMMVYYGEVYDGFSTKEVYPFLIESLSNNTEELPYRGPEEYENDIWRYENVFGGDIEKFSGIEKIYKDEVCVYEARYMGGLVDK